MPDQHPAPGERSLAQRGRPLHGALLFGYAAAVTIWVKNGFRALNDWDLFAGLPFWAVMVALWSALLVFPTAYLAQRVMRWAAD